MGRDIYPVVAYGYLMPYRSEMDPSTNLVYDLQIATDWGVHKATREARQSFKALAQLHKVEVALMGRCEYPLTLIAVRESVRQDESVFLLELGRADHQLSHLDWDQTLRNFLEALVAASWTGAKTAEDFAHMRSVLALVDTDPQWYAGWYDTTATKATKAPNRKEAD